MDSNAREGASIKPGRVHLTNFARMTNSLAIGSRSQVVLHISLSVPVKVGVHFLLEVGIAKVPGSLLPEPLSAILNAGSRSN
jgi:hypothetical protein